MLYIFLFILASLSKIEIAQKNNNKIFFKENKIYELNDSFFDKINKEGKIYRWLILFYSNLNNNCIKAKKEINNTFNSFHHLTEFRFAQMNINENIITKIRLDINKLPYIILLENNFIYEMKLNITKENLEDFIFTIFSEVKNDLKPLPNKPKYINILYFIYKAKLENFMYKFNQVLINNGINIYFNNIRNFIISIICFVVFIYFCIKWIFNFFFGNDEEIALELKQLEEEFNKTPIEIQNDENNLNAKNDINYAKGIKINDYKYIDGEEEEEENEEDLNDESDEKDDDDEDEETEEEEDDEYDNNHGDEQKCLKDTKKEKNN